MPDCFFIHCYGMMTICLWNEFCCVYHLPSSVICQLPLVLASSECPFYVQKYPFLSIWKNLNSSRSHPYQHLSVWLSPFKTDSVCLGLQGTSCKEIIYSCFPPLLREMGFSFIIRAIDLWTAAFHSSLGSGDKPNVSSCPRRTQLLSLSAILTGTSINNTNL